MNVPPLILTLRLNDEAAAFFNQLRKAHFPIERNFIPAHLTLFHHLPSAESSLIDDINEVCLTQDHFNLKVAAIVSTGRGTAYKIESVELSSLQKSFQKKWWAWLTPQDRQGFRPHITVQNKVTVEESRQLQEKLSKDFSPFTIRAAGLDLWNYLGGPWSHAQSFSFLKKAS